MTPQQMKSLIPIAQAAAELIKESPHGIPSGHLYTLLMDKLDLPAYLSMIALLKELGIVQESNYLLTYTR